MKQDKLRYPFNKGRFNLVVHDDEAEPVLRGEKLVLPVDDEQLTPWTRHDLTHRATWNRSGRRSGSWHRQIHTHTVRTIPRGVS